MPKPFRRHALTFAIAALALVQIVVAGTVMVSRASAGGLTAVRVQASPAAAPAQNRVVFAAGPKAPPAVPPPTAATPEGLIRAAMAGRDACLVVRDAAGKQIFDIDGAAPHTPASTQKILVAAAALKTLGPDYRFVTRVLASSPAPGVTDLYLVGGGDPGLVTKEYAAFLAPNARYFGTATTPLWTLADEVRGKGLGAIGSVYADDSRYSTPRYLLGWSTRADEIGGLGALTVNGGWSRWTGVRIAAPDPGVLAAGGLAAQLGVPKFGRFKAPSGAREVARIESSPLAQIVEGMLRASDNLTAETLVLELGYKQSSVGETGSGLRALRGVLTQMGVPTAGLDQRDGSGLDGSNKVSCRTLLGALERGGVAPYLSVAGRNGTLNRRFRQTALAGRMRAKTGWIRGTVGLVGTIDGPRPLHFALLLNGVPDYNSGLAVEDRIASQLSAIAGL